MDASMLRNLVEVQSGPASPPDSLRDIEPFTPLAAPAKAVSRTYPGAPQSSDSIELQRLPTADGNRNDLFGPGTVTPRSNDLEMSRPASPVMSVEVVPTVWQPYMNRWRQLAVCLGNFANALTDGAAGALIPYMESYYNIEYGVVSLIFVGQALGFVFAAVFVDELRARFGRAKLLGLSQLTAIAGFIPLVSAAPWALNVCFFFLVGFGAAVNIAVANTYCGGLRNGTFMLGLLHGSYGIGGTAGPLVATALVTIANASWARYYLITLGFAVINFFLMTWSFWRYEKELSPAAREREAPVADSSVVGGMVGALKLRVVLLGSLFIFAYQGAEVSISGWVISFLINARGGDPSSVGYVTAGFWGGITLGRFLLSHPAQRIGEKVFVYYLIAGSAAFQLLVWLVPNIIGNAVAVSIVGLLLGPIYPCSAATFMRVMTKQEALSGMGTISAFGSLGGAVAPFLVGLLAQAVGTWILHPVVLFLYAVMIACWYGVPAKMDRSE